jgi:AmpD protein
MHITDDHWLSVARRCLSPNQNERPAGVPVSLLVVHGISLPPGEFGGPFIDALFTNTLNPDLHPYFREISALTVSAHLLVRRDGEVVQYVPFDRRAWHAGRSCYDGRENCNDFSIGIELEGTDEVPYTQQQYDVLARVLDVVEHTYPATQGHLAGHSDIAPGRKTDPGPSFDWDRLRSMRN